MLWKIYFWLLLILFSFYYSVVSVLVALGTGRAWDAVDTATSILVVGGVYGFCWRKKIFIQVFWRIFLVAVVLWSIFYTYILPEPTWIKEGSDWPLWAEVLDSLFSYTLTILWVAALYLYGFRREEIWNKQTSSEFVQDNQNNFQLRDELNAGQVAL